MKKSRSQHRRWFGFTLIELLLVVFIIATLGAIAVPHFVGQRRRARSNAGLATLKNVRTAMEMYYQDNNAYPAGIGGFSDMANILASYYQGDETSLQKTLQQFVGYAATPTTYTLDVTIEGASVRATEEDVACLANCENFY